MKFGGTALLVMLTLLLGGFYLFHQRPKAEAKKAAAEFEKRFFRANTGDIVSILIENREGVVEISHGELGWMIEKPQRYRPDDGMIKKLVETIATGQLTRVVGNAADLQQFGFDHPVLSLTLRVGGKRDILVIGQKNPTDTGYYAYSESLGKIFLVNKELPQELYLRLYDLREKRLYPALPVEAIGRVVIARGKETLDVTLKGGVWRMSMPAAATAAPEEMKTFLTRLIDQKAQAFLPWEKKLENLPQQMHLQLFDQQGQSVVNNLIYYLGTGANEGIVAHAPGTTEAVRTGRELWELLQVQPTDLMERRLFPRNSAEISRISLIAGKEQVVLERREGGWLKNGTPINGDKVQLILDSLRNWKATRLVQEKAPARSPATVIEVADTGGVVRLAVTDREMGRALSASVPTVSTGRQDVIYLLSTSSALDHQVLISSHELDHILKQMRQLK